MPSPSYSYRVFEAQLPPQPCPLIAGLPRGSSQLKPLSTPSPSCTLALASALTSCFSHHRSRLPKGKPSQGASCFVCPRLSRVCGTKSSLRKCLRKEWKNYSSQCLLKPALEHHRHCAVGCEDPAADESKRADTALALIEFKAYWERENSRSSNNKADTRCGRGAQRKYLTQWRRLPLDREF